MKTESVLFIMIIALFGTGNVSEANASNSSEDSPDVSFSNVVIVTHNIDSTYVATELEEDVWLLAGVFPSDHNVYLISRDASEIIHTTTGSTDEYFFAHNGTHDELTVIKTDLIDGEEWYGAVAVVSEEPLDCIGVIPQVYDNQEHIMQLDQSVRSSILERGYPYPDYEWLGPYDEFILNIPDVHTLPSYENYVLITYIATGHYDEEIRGPRFLAIDEDIYPLSGGFYSADHITFFKVGSDLYAASRSGVPYSGDCWWEIFKIGPMVRCVYINYFPAT